MIWSMYAGTVRSSIWEIPYKLLDKENFARVEVIWLSAKT